MQRRYLKLALLFSFFLPFLSSSECKGTSEADNDEIAPMFPNLLSLERLKEPYIHLVSESITESGQELTEEYIDMARGKSVFIVSNKLKKTVTYTDTATQLFYKYQPYTCKALTVDELGFDGGLTGIWLANITSLPETKSYGHPASSPSFVLLHGLAAIWYNAGERLKKYSHSEIVYSASKDIYKAGHKWTVKDLPTKSKVHLMFIDLNDIGVGKSSGKEPNFSLEMIQIESLETKKITHTFNILVNEHSIPKEVFASLLNVPVGYGCINEEVTKKAYSKHPLLDNGYFDIAMRHAHHIEIEATAIKFEKTDRSSYADTSNLELARAEASLSCKSLQLVRHRDSEKDVKTIIDSHSKVQYEIDLHKGTCETTNVSPRFLGKYKLLNASDPQQTDPGEDGSERLSIEFSQGLKLDMDAAMMKHVFSDSDGFYYIKSVGNEMNSITNLFLEATSEQLFRGKTSRIMRMYQMEWDSVEVTLSSVTIWVFDSKLEHIEESYQLNIIDVTQLKTRTDLAKAFDISQECYLDDENKRSGRDYAWFQVTYPLDDLQASELVSKRSKIIDTVYQNFNYFGSVGYFRLPRVEAMFEESNLIIRMLMLELPPVELLYDLHKGLSLESDEKAGVVPDLAVDLAHCGRLCRLHQCKAMTFCEDDYVCLITSRKIDLDAGMRKNNLVQVDSCNLYTWPANQGSVPYDENLHRIMSSMRHIDYTAVAAVVPPIPEELTIPLSEQDIDKETRESIHLKYSLELEKNLASIDQSLLALTISLKFRDRLNVLVPSKFELERDPLDELGAKGVSDLLFDSTSNFDDEIEADYDSASESPFHQGLALHRYKVIGIPENDDKLRSWNLYKGVTYEQCSLACIDGRCNSFSYCSHRQECITTDVYSLLNAEQVELDVDCVIMHRDYLSKFHKFSDVYRPQFAKKTLETTSASECAHSCYAETEYQCLAFDYCVPPEQEKDVEGTKHQLIRGTCFHLTDRRLFTGATRDDQIDTSKVLSPSKPTGCDHYSRSFLADFLAIEHRELESSQLSKLKTTQFEHHTVDQCADICVNELIDCTAFQFCLDLSEQHGTIQRCIMIESKPKSTRGEDFEAVIDERSSEPTIEVGKFFKSSSQCHIFSLRSNSEAGKSRELALDSKTKRQSEEEAGANNRNQAKRGLSIAGSFGLFFGIAFISAVIGFGFTVMKERSPAFRARLDQLRVMLGG